MNRTPLLVLAASLAWGCNANDDVTDPPEIPSESVSADLPTEAAETASVDVPVEATNSDDVPRRLASTDEVKEFIESSPTVAELEELTSSLEFGVPYMQGSPYAWTSWRTSDGDDLTIYRWGSVTMSAKLTSKDREDLAEVVYKTEHEASMEYKEFLRSLENGR